MQPYLIEIIMSVVLTVVGYALIRLRKEFEAAENALKKQQAEESIKATQEAMEPMQEELANKLKEVQAFLEQIQSTVSASDELHKEFYKMNLINACKKYNNQGFITQYQFDNLSTVHKIYKNFGGNSQGDEYYALAMKLPIMTKAQGEKIYGKNVNVVDDDEDELYVTPADMGPHTKAVKDWHDND